MRAIVILPFLLLVSACASSGRNFSIAQANRVADGMTREEVIAIMGGPPTTIMDGGKTFIWTYAKVNLLAGTESRSVRFSFNEDGKTYDVPAGGVYGDTAKYQ